MTKAVYINKTGGPEELIYGEIDVKDPKDNEVLIQQSAIGLNYIDVYYRSGLYPSPQLPLVLGLEGCGKIVKLGKSVSGFKVGDRVAYAGGPLGSYAEERVMPFDKLVLVPDYISDQQAASVMLQGLTTYYLFNSLRQLKKNEVILFHAIAGGVGLLAVQWAKSLGAIVIGTVSNKEKADLAKSFGTDYVINYKEENFVERVKEITHGLGVPVVYDSIGKDTFMNSLDCLSPRGMMVSFGQSSGPLEPFNLGLLSSKGSLFITRPSLMHYTSDPLELRTGATALFDKIKTGSVNVNINQTYPLKEAKQAHIDLENRKTTGSTVFTI